MKINDKRKPTYPAWLIFRINVHKFSLRMYLDVNFYELFVRTNTIRRFRIFDKIYQFHMAIYILRWRGRRIGYTETDTKYEFLRFIFCFQIEKAYLSDLNMSKAERLLVSLKAFSRAANAFGPLP